MAEVDDGEAIGCANDDGERGRDYVCADDNTGRACNL
jgi:hypothetical protein